MDTDDLLQSLLSWLDTLHLSAAHRDLQELTDGAAMAEALNQIDSSFFNDAFISKIKPEADNKILKASNLKKVLNGILQYYAEVLGHGIGNEFPMPDTSAIVERSDRGSMGRLLQLILGCAVNCENKEHYIQLIMGLQESVQLSVMSAIQELMQHGDESSMLSSTEDDESKHRLQEQLDAANEARDELAVRCTQLDQQVAALQDEQVNLEQQNQKLLEQLKRGETPDDPETSAGRQRLQQLQQQLEAEQEEVYRTEAARDDFRQKLENAESELERLRLKNTELTSLADEARGLKDELDELRHSSDKVARYETTIDTYKKKLEDLGDVRRQLKILEEKNTSLMEAQLQHEDESAKSGQLRHQLELQRLELAEVRQQTDEQRRRADRAEFELRRAEDKLKVTQTERDRLVEERNHLREAVDEAHLSKLHASEIELEGDKVDELELVGLPPQIRERVIRLERENKSLRAGASGAGNSEALTAMYNDSRERCKLLEEQLRSREQQIMELEASLEDAQMEKQKPEPAPQPNTDELLAMKQKLDNACVKISTLEEERSVLTSELEKRDERMSEMEAKYRKYLDKAKTVIKSLDPKLNPGAGVQPAEVLALRTQIQERDKQIQQLEREQERQRVLREQEEKLIVSAWYNMGVNLQRQSADERLSSTGAGQSFLQRQRQAHSKRVSNAQPAERR